MERGRNSAILLIAVIVIGVTPACWGYDFYVGGQGGWVPDPSVSFNQWAQGNRFRINDRLVFRYKNGEDSVLVVRRVEYETCNTSTAIKKLDGSGFVTYQLDRSGVFFFISGAPGRCEHGQKLIVVVMAPRIITQQVLAPASGPSSSLATSPSVDASPVSGPSSEEVKLAPAPSLLDEADGPAVSPAESVVRASGAVILTNLVLAGAVAFLA